MNSPESINPLPGVRCCYNCEHWIGGYMDDGHDTLGKCNQHPPHGTFFTLYCDDFSGITDAVHLGMMERYPDAPEDGGPSPNGGSLNISWMFTQEPG